VSDRFDANHPVALELAKCRDPATGNVDVGKALARARNPKNVLHKHIDWDQERCIERDLNNQMRDLIKKCAVIENLGERFVYIPRYLGDIKDTKRGYTPLEVVSASVDRQKQQIDGELSTLKGPVRRLAVLAMKFDIEADVRKRLHELIDAAFA
jgi:hypothetical protein